MPNDEISQIQLPNGDMYDIRDGNVSDFKTNIDEETLSDGQVLKYNEDTGEWKNAKDKTEYVGSASGAVASFNTDLTNNLIEVVCYIQYQQASGTPTPVNPLPIQVFDFLTLYHNDVNIWNGLYESGVYNSSGQKSNDNDQIRSVNFISVRPDTEYYVLFPTSVTGRILFYDKSQNFISRTSGSTSRTFTTPSNCYYITWYCATTVFNNDISINYPSTDTQYHAFNGAYIPFGQTVAKGTLNVTTGVLRTTMSQLVALNTLNWVKTQVSQHDCFYADLNNGSKESFPNFDGLCTDYANTNDTGMSADNTIRFYGSTQYNFSRCLIRDDSKASLTAEQFKTAVTGSIIYELETPIEIQLDSTQITALLNENNIWCDTNGDTEVKFVKNSIPSGAVSYDNTNSGLEATDTKNAIDELSKRSSDYHVYSTDEQVVGRWIDGNDIYEKTVTISNATIRVNGGYSYDISGWNVDVLVKSPDAYIVLSSGTDLRTVPFGILGSYAVEVYASRSAVSFARKGADLTCDQIVFTLRYTKTSSNTRSLNLSKGSSEELPIEEKKEELKEPEEVKEVQDE